MDHTRIPVIHWLWVPQEVFLFKGVDSIVKICFGDAQPRRPVLRDRVVVDSREHGLKEQFPLGLAVVLLHTHLWEESERLG